MMVTCGIQTLEEDRLGEQSFLPSYNQIRDNLRIILSFLLISMLVLFAGCVPSLKFGSPPRVNRLASLQRGVSTSNDVLLSLGTPRGSGNAHFNPTLDPRKIWFYEYVESDGKNVQLKFLLVFFEKDLYDGYLWFISDQAHEVDSKIVLREPNR
jgi:hypothetical protein